VIIVNEEYEAMNLEGWEIQNDRSDSYEFGDLKLDAGERIHVYTNSKEKVTNSHENAVYDSGVVWTNGGDTATLFNNEGIEMVEDSY